MSRVHTHYDNLKVARNAPRDVIRAAYRVLAQRYHPDVNPSADAARVMGLLNEAWAVLSDDKKRAAHDAWILEKEQLYKATHEKKPATEQQAPKTEKHATRGATASSSQPSLEDQFNAWLAGLSLKTYALAALAAIVAISWYAQRNFSFTPEKLAGATEVAQPANSTAPSQPRFDRCVGNPEPEKCRAEEIKLAQETPSERLARQKGLEASRHPKSRLAVSPPELQPTAIPAHQAPKDRDQQTRTGYTLLDPDPVVASGPKDRDQQTRTGYAEGYPKLARDGMSEFTVDNSVGGKDAIARLYLEGRRPAVRTFFIRQGETFTAGALSPGDYVLRYRYMGSKTTYEADQLFRLTEEITYEGTRYSKVRVTLYTTINGNLQTKTVPDDSF